MKLLLGSLIFFFLNFYCAFAYTLNTENGSDFIRWNSSGVTVYINPVSSDISDSSARSIISQSITEWNSKTPFTVGTQVTYDDPAISRWASIVLPPI